MYIQNDTCHIKHVPFRGVDCSDAAGTQINYYQMKDYLEYSKEGLKWNGVSHTPYFTLSINVSLFFSILIEGHWCCNNVFVSNTVDLTVLMVSTGPPVQDQ